MIGRDTMAGRNVPAIPPRPPAVPAWAFAIAIAALVAMILV